MADLNFNCCILCKIISTATMPKGCSLNDVANCKCNTACIECPKPQPGQYGKLSHFNKHILGAEELPFIKNKNRRPEIQNNNSKFFCKMCLTILYIFKIENSLFDTSNFKVI